MSTNGLYNTQPQNSLKNNPDLISKTSIECVLYQCTEDKKLFFIFIK